MENGRGNAVVMAEEEGAEEDGVGTGPAPTRADRDRIPDHQRSAASRRRDARRVVRSTESDALAVGPSRSMKEDTPSTAKIAAGMNVVRTTEAVTTVTTGTGRRATALITLAIAAVVAVVASAEECEAAVDPVISTRAVGTVAIVATYPSKDRRISTVIRAWPRWITTITIRPWWVAVAFRSITTLRWRLDRLREVTMRFHRSNSSSSSK